MKFSRSERSELGMKFSRSERSELGMKFRSEASSNQKTKFHFPEMKFSVFHFPLQSSGLLRYLSLVPNLHRARFSAACRFVRGVL